MKSRLLAKLEETMRNGIDSGDGYRAKTKAAAHYGKLGDVAKARSLLSEVRSEPNAMSEPSVVSLINWAEGLLEFRSGDSDRGVDKWNRARAIASAVDFSEGAAIASAWLAFAAYLREDLIDLSKNARFALQGGIAEYPQALSRLSLTLALCFHYCGDITSARRYYGISHRAATECGDEVELSALIHDMSTMLIHEKRVASFVDLNGRVASTATATNLASADSYEDLIGVRGLQSLSPQLAAYEAVVDGRWSDSIALIDRSLESAVKDGYSRLVPALLADRALCHLMLNEVSAAQTDIEQSLSAYSISVLHRDDRAIYFSRLSQVYGLMGNDPARGEYAGLARQAWGLVEEFEMEMRSVVAAIHTEFEARLGAAEK